MSKNSKIFVKKYIKVLEFKKIKTFLNKGTKNKINYMEGLNSKKKNIKGVGSPQGNFILKYLIFLYWLVKCNFMNLTFCETLCIIYNTFHNKMHQNYLYFMQTYFYFD